MLLATFAFSVSLSFAGVGKYDPFPGGWNMPFAGYAYVSQGYNGACGGDYASHFGSILYAIDLASNGDSKSGVYKNSKVFAPASGYVKYADWDSKKGRAWEYGKQVIVETGDTGQKNGNRYIYRVAHLNNINVRAGWWVNKGDVLGWVGDTGQSSGNHIHFNINRGSYANYGLISGDSFKPSYSSGIDNYNGCCNCKITSEF